MARGAGAADLEPSLDAVLALSYDRLPDDDARQALRKLAVFGAQPITFDAPAMAAVWEMKRDAAHRAELVDAGLLEVAPDDGADRRYSLHQIVLAFAAARLAATPDEGRAARMAHARHFAGVVAGYDGGIQAGRMTYSEPLEWEHVATALERLRVVQADDEEAARVLLAYARHWRNVLFNNHDRRRLAWLNAAVDAARRVGETGALANVLKAQGDVLAFLDQRDEALGVYEEALTLFRAVGARLGEANVLKAQGDVLAFLDQRDEALGVYEEALTLFRAVGARLGEANVLKAQATLLLREGDVEEGLALLEEARQLYAAVGDRVGLANVGINLARHHAAAGRYAQAIECMQPAADFGFDLNHSLGPQLQAEIDGWRKLLDDEPQATGDGSA